MLPAMRAEKAAAADKYNELLDLYEARQAKAKANGYWLPKGAAAAHLQAYSVYEGFERELATVEFAVRSGNGPKAQFNAPGKTSSFLKRPPPVV